MKTNVLIIVVDALRSDRVGALGGRELTPNIDDLAAESAVFTNAYSTINATDVAVTSIQTGRYPLSHGVVNHGPRVTDREKNTVEQITQLPEVLSESGYVTAKLGRPLGRWHRKGFNKYPSSMEQRVAFDKRGEDENKSAKQKIGDSLERIHPALRTTASKLYQSIQTPPEKLYQSTQTPPEKSELIAKYQDASDEVVQNFEEFIRRPTPFYAFVHLMDTHTAYEANPEVVKSHLGEFKYRTDVPMRGTGSHPEYFDELIENGEYPEIKEKYYLPDGSPTTAITDAHYDAAVTQADDRVGEILTLLKESGSYDDTLIMVLSDHGESLTEHGIYHDHHGLYDESVHIPLIIRPPNGASKEITELVQITDIAPTIEQYTDTDGIDADGYSLRPIIEKNQSIDRQYVLAEEAHTQRRRMVRSKDSKLIYSLDGNTICRYCDVQHASEIEFYDLVKDPNETENIVKNSEDRVSKLQRYGDKKAKEYNKKRPKVDTEEKVTYEDEKEVKDRLEALGYR
jgi:arylsulfatase A-like enzyme